MSNPNQQSPINQVVSEKFDVDLTADYVEKLVTKAIEKDMNVNVIKGSLQKKPDGNFSVTVEKQIGEQRVS